MDSQWLHRVHGEVNIILLTERPHFGWTSCRCTLPGEISPVELSAVLNQLQLACSETLTRERHTGRRIGWADRWILKDRQRLTEQQMDVLIQDKVRQKQKGQSICCKHAEPLRRRTKKEKTKLMKL